MLVVVVVIKVVVMVHVVRKDLNYYFCLSKSHGTLSFKIDAPKKENQPCILVSQWILRICSNPERYHLRQLRV